MAWFERVAAICKRLGNSMIIKDREDLNDYLERFYVLPRWASFGLFRVVIHRFWRSDNPLDGLHDHPWPYITIILRGGYFEHTPKGTFLRKPGDVVFARSSHLHRVELCEEDSDTWTLFIMGPRLRHWGFLVDGVWYPWADWIEKRKAK